MKSHLLLVFYILLFISCKSQTHKEFNLFLNNFIDVDYPIVPSQIFLDIEIRMETNQISEYDFNKYLRLENGRDSVWRFGENYDFTYGGKFEVHPNIICVLYRRDYMPDDINEQMGEVVLMTLSNVGDIISCLPISGGYGDSITFTSIIHDSQVIEVKYKTYSNDDVLETIKTYKVEKSGRIIPR